MENSISIYIEEVQKINLRVKEFLWKEKYFWATKSIKWKMLEANFWQDKSRSKKILKEKKLFEDLTNSFKNSEKNLADFKELYKLAIEESNNDLLFELSVSAIIATPSNSFTSKSWNFLKSSLTLAFTVTHSLKFSLVVDKTLSIDFFV